MKTRKLEETRECAIILAGAIFKFIQGKTFSSNTLWECMERSNIGCKANAIRIFNYFKNQRLIIKDGKYRWNGKVDEWFNDVDKRNNLVFEMLRFGDIIQHRGRVKGKKYPPKSIPESEVKLEEQSVRSIDDYSDKDLVDELRRRGWTVTATKEL